MVLAMMIVPFNDTLTKLLTGALNPIEIAFWRYLFQSAIMLCALVLVRQSLRPQASIGLLALGGALSAGTLVALIGAFAVMPIATAVAIFFVEPLILLVLSVIFLGERAGWRRYLAVVVGLAGAIVVIRPSWSDFGWQAILPVVAAALFAGNLICIRKASARMPTLAVQSWMTGFGTLMLAVLLALGGASGLIEARWVGALTEHAPMFVLMGVVSATTFIMISEAFKRSSPTTLAPFQYLEIIGATILGYIVFGDFPDLLTWVGTAIILASGLYVIHRERIAKRQAQ